MSPDQQQSLVYVESGDPLIVRSSDQRHRFPILGIEIEISDGWTYLSVADDLRAAAPTFVHQKSGSILRLEPFRLRSWPPQGAELELEQYGEFSCEWSEIDHRRVGRMREPPVDVAILVITHQSKAKLNPEVRSFCRGIRLIP